MNIWFILRVVLWSYTWLLGFRGLYEIWAGNRFEGNVLLGIAVIVALLTPFVFGRKTEDGEV